MIQGVPEEEWARTVRDPAEQAKEGLRRLDCGRARAEYQAAPLPDGRWAIRLSCTVESSAGMHVPWRVFPTREDCLASFQQEATAFFERERNLKKDREKARQQILALLRGSLFGFAEPEPS